MSYKDLEAEIRAWANLEAYAKQQKEDAAEARRQAKRDKLARKKKPSVLVPRQPVEVVKPVRVFKIVKLEVRPIHHRKWGDLEYVTYSVETISNTAAEVEAIKQARADGYSFDRVVSMITVEK